MSSFCLKCARHVRVPCVPCFPANDNEPPPWRGYVASDWELRRLSHHHRLAISVAALGLSQRKTGVWLASALTSRPVEAFWPGGTLFPLADTVVDDTFKDPNFYWVRDLKNMAPRGPKQKAQWKVLPKLRLLDLGFRIVDPKRAAWIAR